MYLTTIPIPLIPPLLANSIYPALKHTALKIYSILAAEVAKLAANKHRVGLHTYHFNGTGLASGVNYYQVTAGEYSDVKKMILLR